MAPFNESSGKTAETVNDVREIRSANSNSPAVTTAVASSNRLTAYSISYNEMQIHPASAKRAWMEATKYGFANRCLPLRIANEAGWFILNDRRVEVIWNGGNEIRDLTVRVQRKSPQESVSSQSLVVASHFGYGILTWRIPFLFRTAAGENLYVRGPSNWCKDGICPLDAIVETDWSAATFTMNWKVTRVDYPISFEKGEPICMLFPFPRGYLEKFSPELREISDEPELEDNLSEWSESRYEFNRELRTASKPLWQKHYYVGKSIKGDVFSGHQLKLGLRSFEDMRKLGH